MILDSREREITAALTDNERIPDRIRTDPERLECGERYLTIPEGIDEIRNGAFEEYNKGVVAANIMNMLLRYEDQVAE